MRFLLEIAIIWIFLCGLAVVSVMYLKQRRGQAQLRSAYFSGGQLDGATKKLGELPSLVTHGEEVYRKEHDTGGEAIYVYVGEVRGEDITNYEIT
jgi:hypothetical protein